MSITRTKLHKRTIELDGYLRDDGLWEVEAELTDIKGYDVNLMRPGFVPAGEKFHNMTITIVYNDHYEILDVRTSMPATPFIDCPEAQVNYKALIGLQFKSGWMQEVKARLPRTSSCTHISEMLPAIATAAFQTRQGYIFKQQKEKYGKVLKNDAQLNTCYGYRDEALVHKE